MSIGYQNPGNRKYPRSIKIGCALENIFLKGVMCSQETAA